MLPIYANGHISATGDPIHFMFGSRVGFSGLADRMALFLVRSNPGWRPAAILENYSGIAQFPCDSITFLFMSVCLYVYLFVAMRIARCILLCLSIRLSLSGIVSKRLNVLYNSFDVNRLIFNLVFWKLNAVMKF